MNETTVRLFRTMNPKRLRILCAVAEHGSLSAAAAELSYSTSAVSEHMAALEREAGTQLLERLPRGVRLTDAGRLVAERGHAILGSLAALRGELDDLAGLHAGRLRLGAFATAGATLAPRAVAAFRASHPGVELELTEADPDEAIELLASRELDLALVYAFEREPPLPIEARELLTDELRVLLPAGHRLSGQETVELAELADEPWIQGVRHGSTVHVLPEACRAVGFEPRIAFRTDDPTAVHGFVAAGIGVAVASQLLLPIIRSDVVVRTLRPAQRRGVGVALPPTGARTPGAEAMVDVLVEVAAGLVDQPPRALRSS